MEEPGHARLSYVRALSLNRARTTVVQRRADSWAVSLTDFTQAILKQGHAVFAFIHESITSRFVFGFGGTMGADLGRGQYFDPQHLHERVLPSPVSGCGACSRAAPCPVLTCTRRTRGPPYSAGTLGIPNSDPSKQSTPSHSARETNSIRRNKWKVHNLKKYFCFVLKIVELKLDRSCSNETNVVLRCIFTAVCLLLVVLVVHGQFVHKQDSISRTRGGGGRGGIEPRLQHQHNN